MWGTGVREKTQTFLEARPAKSKLQGSPYAHVGMDAVQLTQADFPPKVAPLKHPRPCRRPGSSCYSERTFFDVNVNWGSSTGLPRCRVQIYVRALPDLRPEVIRSEGAILIASVVT